MPARRMAIARTSVLEVPTSVIWVVNWRGRWKFACRHRRCPGTEENKGVTILSKSISMRLDCWAYRYAERWLSRLSGILQHERLSTLLVDITRSDSSKA